MPRICCARARRGAPDRPRVGTARLDISNDSKQYFALSKVEFLKKSRKIARFLWAAALTATAVADVRSSDEPLVTDRPDQTESASIVPAGRVQIETGAATARREAGDVDTELSRLGGTLLRVGVSARAELRFGWDGVLRLENRADSGATLDGSGDSAVGAKILLVEARGRRPQSALIVTALLPTGDDALGRERVDPSFRLANSHELTPRLGLGYNLGADWFSLRDDDDGQTHTLSRVVYTVVLGVGLGARTGAFVEAFGSVAASEDGGPAHALDAGFTWLVRHNVQLDATAGLGLSDEADAWFLGFGACARFPR